MGILSGRDETYTNAKEAYELARMYISRGFHDLDDTPDGVLGDMLSVRARWIGLRAFAGRYLTHA